MPLTQIGLQPDKHGEIGLEAREKIAKRMVKLARQEGESASASDDSFFSQLQLRPNPELRPWSDLHRLMGYK
jgi:hypothetical protein